MCDNGNPWGSSQAEGYTLFEVWMMELGILVLHGRPLHPQTQGKEERFNSSLKKECLRYVTIKEIVYHGPAEKKHIFYHAKGSNQAGELDFTYYNAVYTVENALAKVKDESGMKRVEKFLKEEICPDCHGSRLSAAARAPKLRGISLDEACTMTLAALVEWVHGVPDSLPEEMYPMAESICEAFASTAKRLMDLGLGYLTQIGRAHV